MVIAEDTSVRMILFLSEGTCRNGRPLAQPPITVTRQSIVRGRLRPIRVCSSAIEGSEVDVEERLSPALVAQIDFLSGNCL